MKTTTAIAACLFAFVAVAAGADNDELLHRRIQDTIKKVTPAYVFVGGGSGVVISADGYMLTNFHVAGDREKIRVRLTGGRSFTANRVGTDPEGDVVLLKIESKQPLPFVELGDSDKLEIGQYLIAVGNPFALGTRSFEPSVSVGILSAFRRSSNYFDAVQTDTAINPGNSGGPLFDLDGRLIAINGRMSTRFGNRVATGTAYSIPVNQLKRFIPRFIEARDKDKGRVRHGEVPGLSLTSDPPEQRGAKVKGVETDSQAEKAGLKQGDVILEVEGYPIFNARRFGSVIGTYPAGSTLKLTVLRDGKQFPLELALTELHRTFLGVRQDPSASSPLGALIAEVLKGQPAEAAGMQNNDIVIEFNGVKIRNWNDLLREIQRAKPYQPFTAKVLREKKELVLRGKLGDR